MASVLKPLFVFLRLSSGMKPVVDIKTPAGRETGYGIQNVRYVFQIMTDAIAVRRVLRTSSSLGCRPGPEKIPIARNCAV